MRVSIALAGTDSELRPPEDPFAGTTRLDYLSEVHRVLLANVENSVVQVVILAAWRPEEAVFISELPENRGYNVEHVQALTSIAKHITGDPNSKIETIHHEASIDASVVRKLQPIWTCASQNAKYVEASPNVPAEVVLARGGDPPQPTVPQGLRLQVG